MVSKRLRILYKVGRFRGASPLSLLRYATAMREKGHEILFVGEDGIQKKRFDEESEFEVEEIGAFRFSRPFHNFYYFIKYLKIIHRFKPDIIHATTVLECFISQIAAALMNIHVICNVSGDIYPDRLIPIKKYGRFFVYSEEAKDNLMRFYKFNKEDIILFKERIDYSYQQMPYYPQRIWDRIETIGKETTIMFPVNIDEDKVSAVSYVLDAYRILIEQGYYMSLVIVGDGEFKDEMARKAASINHENRLSRVIMKGEVPDAKTITEMATYIIGSGRAIIEGMAQRKPCIVVGKKGSAGIVTNDSIRKLAYYDFSGRDLIKPQRVRKLVLELIKLYENRDFAEQCAEYAELYAKEYDFKNITDKLEEMYCSEAEKTGKVKLYKRIIFIINAVFTLTWKQIVFLYRFIKDPYRKKVKRCEYGGYMY